MLVQQTLRFLKTRCLQFGLLVRGCTEQVCSIGDLAEGKEEEVKFSFTHLGMRRRRNMWLTHGPTDRTNRHLGRAVSESPVHAMVACLLDVTLHFISTLNPTKLRMVHFKVAR